MKSLAIDTVRAAQAGVQPDRYEWLHAEQARRAADPTGLRAARAAFWRRWSGWHFGFAVAACAPCLILGVLQPIVSRSEMSIALIVVGTLASGVAVAIWRVRPATPFSHGAGWGALFFGVVMLGFGVSDVLPHALAPAAASVA